MGSSTTIKIRYCGGCNQAYDRVKLVSDIVKSLHEQNGKDFRVVFGRDDPADIELVICGCSACCSDTDEQKDEPTPRREIRRGPEPSELLRNTTKRPLAATVVADYW